LLGVEKEDVMDFDTGSLMELNPGKRTLLGAGPSEVPTSVLQALATPPVGHLDPYFLEVMDETQRLLRYLMQTENALTIPVSGTGSAGMETCFVNLVEPGDEVLVCVNGVFGTRMCDIVTRLDGRLIRVDGEWGRAMDPDPVRKAVQGRMPKLLALVHAETSTGACTPLAPISEIARDCGALFLVDMVTSLGGMEVYLDKLGIDAAFSATQKCISCPPGLSPISFSPKAMDALKERRYPVASWYLDMSMVSNYWGAQRKYHHTAPINMIFALREALKLTAEEGLEARFARHRLNHLALVAGLEAMGLSMLVPEGERLPMLNAIRIPDGVDDAKVRKRLLREFGIEIGGGLGGLAGKIWRVGLMGESSCQRNVFQLLRALEMVLGAEGVKINPVALEAASAVYAEFQHPALLVTEPPPIAQEA
jgi:alanine-glyoxylate transaminase/serine-glyoxylate transaminase/serine-pyruvate transaminase